MYSSYNPWIICRLLFYFIVRLNNGPNSKSGGLEMYHQAKWFGVCDEGFGLNEARVACRSLKAVFTDARAIPGKNEF